MPRAKSKITSDTNADFIATQEAPVAKRKSLKKPYYNYEIALVHGAGEHYVYFNTKEELDHFVLCVTKRNLNAYPYLFTDIAGQTFILREFLFCRIVQNQVD